MSLLPQAIADLVAQDGIARQATADDGTEHMLFRDGMTVRSCLVADWPAEQVILAAHEQEQLDSIRVSLCELAQRRQFCGAALALHSACARTGEAVDSLAAAVSAAIDAAPDAVAGREPLVNAIVAVDTVVHVVHHLRFLPRARIGALLRVMQANRA